jgi:uncharacterized protein YggE
VPPDQARIDIGVVTQATSAQTAVSQNATQLQSVLDRLHALLGTSADIHTAGYSVSPNYQYPRDGGQPTITGYTATNIVQVTTSDLKNLGKVIDVSSASGANRIQSLQFTLKNESAARAQALKQAAAEARTNADAMASALGLKLGRVLQIEQGTPEVVRPMMREMAMAAAAPPTPVQPGNVQVHATVTLTVALE